MGRLRRIFACDRGIAVIVLGDPVVETDGSHDRPAGTRRGAVSELGDDRNPRIEGFPGADAAILREGIERYVDLRKGQQMLVARGRAQADDVLLGNALRDEPRDQAVAQHGIVKQGMLDDDL